MSFFKKLPIIPKTRFQYGALLFILCMAGYLFLYTGRGALATSIPGITAEGLFSKQALGTVGTVFFITYGMMQTPMGMLADRVRPHIMITLGLAGSAVFTLLTEFAVGSVWTYIFWGLNGVMQACLWPSVVKSVAEIMPTEQRLKGSIYLALSGPIGSMGLYVTSAIVFSFTGWRSLFLIVSAMMAAFALVAYFGLGRINRHLQATADEDPYLAKIAQAQKADAPKAPVVKLLLQSGAVFLLLPCLTFGVIREGINMWSPTLLVEKFQVSSVQAMVLSVCLPLVAALAVPLTLFLLKRAKGRELNSSILCHALSVVLMAVVLLTAKSSLGPVFCIALLALTIMMQGVTSAIISAIIVYFGKFRITGTVLGIMNLSTMVGSALVSFLMGWVSQHFGWNSALWIWMVASVIGLVFTIMANPRWEKFKQATQD